MLYDLKHDYEWNYLRPPAPTSVPFERVSVPGAWTFCGQTVPSPLGISAGPLLNSGWLLHYARLGFDVLTYKTVRSRHQPCLPMPNLTWVDAPVVNEQVQRVSKSELPSSSWAISFGMPSRAPAAWQSDVTLARAGLKPDQLLVVSVVATPQESWTLKEVADDYAACAVLARESGADCVELNFSCPNVDTCDGQLFQQVASATYVAQRVRERLNSRGSSNGPTRLIIKLGHITDPSLAARLVEHLSPIVDAFSMTNCIAARVASDHLLFNGQPRGIGGTAILDASIRQVEIFQTQIEAQKAALRIIGVGGISSAQHVKRYLNAGAEAVQLATAAMQQPEIAFQILTELAADFT